MHQYRSQTAAREWTNPAITSQKETFTMIIEPEIFNHPKFLHFKKDVGGMAMEYLVRLWAHCHGNKRGQFWPDANGDYVELVITGRNKKGRVYAALLKHGWVHESAQGIEVHDWGTHNKSLVARWDRDKNPKQTRAQESAQTPTQSTTGLDCKGQNRTGGDTPPPSSAQMAPTCEQAVKYFESLQSGYTRQQVEQVWHSFNATRDPIGGWWKWGKTMVQDWRSAMESRLLSNSSKNVAPAAQQREPGTPPPPPKATVDFDAMKV
jgi:hypothetical protein